MGRALAWLLALLQRIWSRPPRRRKRPYGKRMHADRRVRHVWKEPWKSMLYKMRRNARR